MNKLAVVLAALLLPTILNAAQIRGTVIRVDPAQSRVVLKTERGEETYETTKETKGAEHLKIGTNVTITFTEKDGDPKVIEVTRN